MFDVYINTDILKLIYTSFTEKPGIKTKITIDVME